MSYRRRPFYKRNGYKPFRKSGRFPKTSKSYRRKFIQKKSGVAYQTIKLVRHDMFQHRWSFKTGTSGNQNWSQEVFDHCAAAFPPETPKIKSVFDQYQKKKLLKLTVSLKNLKFHYRKYGDTFIDTTDDASTLMQCESKDYFDVFYLRSNNAPYFIYMSIKIIKNPYNSYVRLIYYLILLHYVLIRLICLLI